MTPSAASSTASRRHFRNDHFLELANRSRGGHRNDHPQGATLGAESSIGMRSEVEPGASLGVGSHIGDYNMVKAGVRTKAGSVVPTPEWTEPDKRTEMPSPIDASNGVIDENHKAAATPRNRSTTRWMGEEQHAKLLKMAPGICQTTRVDVTAVIRSGVRIGEGAKIHGGAHVSAYADIGAGADVGPDAIVGPRAPIGEDATIGAGTVVENEARVGDGATIGEDVRIAGRGVGTPDGEDRVAIDGAGRRAPGDPAATARTHRANRSGRRTSGERAGRANRNERGARTRAATVTVGRSDAQRRRHGRHNTKTSRGTSMDGRDERGERPENAARGYTKTTNGRRAYMCAECFHNAKKLTAANAVGWTPVDAEDERRGRECDGCTDQIIELTPLRAVMEISNNGIDFEPLEDPNTGTAEVLVAGDEAPARDSGLQLAFEREIPPAAHRRPAPTDRADEAAGFVPAGEMVADLREQCGCSVAEFADLIQVTATTVRRWETTPGPLNLHAAPWEALRALYLESRKHQG